jgi:GNAT superfamily N-acetyltransferase
VNDVRFPAGYHLEQLRRDHPRKNFRSGQQLVDDWLATNALQHQTKHLSATKVLVDAGGAIAGYYTLAPAQIDFSDLPAELGRRLPHRMLPAALVAWLGVDAARQGQGLGSRLLGQAFRDCWEGGKIFPFVLVILDCVDEKAKSFYGKCGFAELPGQPYRLYLSAQQLEAMMQRV